MNQKSMSKLVPFKLDPMLRVGFNTQVQCSDCGKSIEFRVARIVVVNISDSRRGKPAKEVSLDEWFRKTTWAFLCQECWNKEHRVEPKVESIQ